MIGRWGGFCDVSDIPPSAAAAGQGQSAGLGLLQAATGPPRRQPHFLDRVHRVPRRQANHLPASRPAAAVVKHAGMHVHEDPLIYCGHHLATRPGRRAVPAVL